MTSDRGKNWRFFLQLLKTLRSLPCNDEHVTGDFNVLRVEAVAEKKRLVIARAGLANIPKESGFRSACKRVFGRCRPNETRG